MITASAVAGMVFCGRQASHAEPPESWQRLVELLHTSGTDLHLPDSYL